MGFKSLDNVHVLMHKASGKALGQEGVSNEIVETALQKTKAVLAKTPDANFQSTFNRIFEETAEHAGKKDLAQQITKHSKEHFLPRLRRLKNVEYFVPLSVAIGSSWAFMRLLNFYITPWRYKNQNAQTANTVNTAQRPDVQPVAPKAEPTHHKLHLMIFNSTK